MFDWSRIKPRKHWSCSRKTQFSVCWREWSTNYSWTKSLAYSSRVDKWNKYWPERYWIGTLHMILLESHSLNLMNLMHFSGSFGITAGFQLSNPTHSNSTTRFNSRWTRNSGRMGGELQRHRKRSGEHFTESSAVNSHQQCVQRRNHSFKPRWKHDWRWQILHRSNDWG